MTIITISSTSSPSPTLSSPSSSSPPPTSLSPSPSIFNYYLKISLTTVIRSPASAARSNTCFQSSFSPLTPRRSQFCTFEIDFWKCVSLSLKFNALRPFLFWPDTTFHVGSGLDFLDTGGGLPMRNRSKSLRSEFRLRIEAVLAIELKSSKSYSSASLPCICWHDNQDNQHRLVIFYC